MQRQHLHIWPVLAVSGLLASSGVAIADETVDQDFEDIDLQEVALVANLVTLGVGTSPEGGGVVFGEGGPYRGTGSGLAGANCQWLLAVNTIVATIFEVDQLGVVTDEDTFTETSPPPSTLREHNGGSNGGGNTTIIANASASCEQDVGPVFVRLDVASGFGEPAPQAEGMLEALASVASARAASHGGTPEDVIDQDVERIEKTAIAGVLNLASIEVVGSGNAATNCQLAISWNTVVINDISVTQTATVNDDDTFSRESPPTGGLELASIGNANNGPPRGDLVETASAESHCRQSVDSITLTTGDDDVPTIPPQS